ncbi:MAG TPA: hypothetical protein VFL90_15415 [Methylomirabilota bacterium]|nr:hypothetical protein [Methylomirabilota bacterium]
MSPARDPGDGRADTARIFLTAWLVYLLFLNPMIPNSVAAALLDGAVSVVDTGHWEARHAVSYGGIDVARSGDRLVPGPPPGLAVLIVPVYAVWRLAVGPARTDADFIALHVVATIVISAVASALAAAQVAALARWFGASAWASRASGLVFAFGSPAFLFATRLFKENVAALGIVAAWRLAREPGGAGRRALAGVVAGLTTLVAYPAALAGPALALAIARREGGRRCLAFVAGWGPGLGLLALYNTWLFGRPWRFSYGAFTSLPEGAGRATFVVPSAAVLLKLLFAQREGLLLYSPFLLAGVLGLFLWRRHQSPADAAMIGAFALVLLFISASWLTQFPSTATGARYGFLAVPLLAAFAAVGLDYGGRPALLLLGAPSVALTYLIVQAGHIADPAPLLYAAKTFVSGTGMAVLFKEILPRWIGLDTLHTLLGRREITGAELPALLGTVRGWRLVGNQLLMLLTFGVALGIVGVVLRLLWKPAGTARLRPAP